jgi:single-strand DNA-binding protein
MNRVILMGRLTRDPDIRYAQGEGQMCIARYTLAVDRRFSRNNNDGQTADFISCVAFGRSGEFAEKYLRKGTKIAVTGRLQTGSYTNKDGVKVYTTDVVVEDQEFAESKNAAQGGQNYDRSNYSQQGGGYNAGRGSQNRQQGGYNAPQAQPQGRPAPENDDAIDGFMNIPEGIDEELPFT